MKRCSWRRERRQPGLICGRTPFRLIWVVIVCSFEIGQKLFLKNMLFLFFLHNLLWIKTLKILICIVNWKMILRNASEHITMSVPSSQERMISKSSDFWRNSLKLDFKLLSKSSHLTQYLSQLTAEAPILVSVFSSSTEKLLPPFIPPASFVSERRESGSLMELKFQPYDR